MTHRNDYILTSELAVKGLGAGPEFLRILINHAMQAERVKYLQADEYELSEDRIGHANGYKPKTVGRQTVDRTLPTSSNVLALPLVQRIGRNQQDTGWPARSLKTSSLPWQGEAFF